MSKGEVSFNPDGIIVRAKNYIEDRSYRQLVDDTSDRMLDKLLEISPTAPQDLQVQARLFKEKIREMIKWELDNFGRIVRQREIEKVERTVRWP